MCKFNKAKSGNCQGQMLWQVVLLPAWALGNRKLNASEISHLQFLQSARTLAKIDLKKKKKKAFTEI